MKHKELFKQSSPALEQTLQDIKQELIKVNAQIATKTTLENPGQKKSMRQTIARIKTILNQREKVKLPIEQKED
ncbi:50S ribosomal protein L29 [archaeon]|nr:50S ribosomal protein L29 [archaeon]|tara:strand:- start:816 stop:1037 length:222 start_codon:yes stop_codon:yes gene_type:complete